MTHRMGTLLLMVLVLATRALPIGAQGTFPGPDWEEKPDPLASPWAVPGGRIVVFGGQMPKSLNYYLETSSFSAQIFGRMYGTLLGSNSVTLEDEPAIANKWTVSEDKRVFTFWIDPRAKWSDGRPITAEDVQWTYDTIMDPKNLTGPHKVALGRLERPEVLVPDQVRFTAREVHWSNLDTAGSMQILPKHVFEGQDFNLVNFDFPVVSGPYRVGEVRDGLWIDIVREPNWWERDLPRAEGVANFDEIRFRVFSERTTGYEAFLKGDIDLYPVYTSRIWVTETSGGAFDRNWIVRQKVINHEPIRLQGWVMNMRKPPFDDVRVRQAMGHLLNRWRMNSDLMYDQYLMHKAYWEDLYGPEHPAPREPLPYDPEAARRLLAEAGWKVNPATGKLEKDGEPFVFRYLQRDPSFTKFLLIYAQDLESVGIEMQVDLKDWSSWVKDMDSFHFDMTGAAWSSGVKKDPEPMWHSSQAEAAAGFNYPGFKNDRVDALIEKQKAVFDLEKRNEVLREIEQIVYDEHPYALTWYANYTRLLYWNKFGTPPWVLSKYGSENSALDYWWADPDLEAALQDAKQTGATLPPREGEVRFDEVFAE